jgi:diguanylate cyclase (GGDEF)-like protein
MAIEKSRRVLIADDDAHTRNLLKELLEGWGYGALMAEDGQQALALASQAPVPDLALLDLMMPGLDGFTVLKRLRSAPATADLPVIILTAAGEVDDKLKGIELGANDYVTKPFRIGELQHRVEVVLAQKREAAEAVAVEEPEDSLNGVGTFPQLKETLGYEVARARRYTRPLTALMVAVDDPPSILETRERAETNDLLTQLAAALQRSFRAADRIFRIDVEAFVVLLPETPADGARIAASRLAAALKADPLKLAEARRYTVSVGIADFPRFGMERADELLRAANHALLFAQRQGPARVEIADGVE